MSWVIHYRQKNGKDVFRLWSSMVDGYVSGELSEEEVKEKILQEQVRIATENCLRETPGRIARAKVTGTSSQVEDDHCIHGKWMEQRE